MGSCKRNDSDRKGDNNKDQNDIRAGNDDGDQNGGRKLIVESKRAVLVVNFFQTSLNGHKVLSGFLHGSPACRVGDFSTKGRWRQILV